ncbi:MAG: hypothetical protein K2Y21_07565 [Phycisphaerales bacterium]|nr:hypothetical protein [Phycisphaerales bacterium]
MVRFMLVNVVTALLWVGGILGLFYGLPMMLRSTKISPIVFVGLMAPLVVGVVQTFVIYKAARWLWAPIEAREMLRKCLCPHCRFSLVGISPDPDGCTVCPECGAAWRLTVTNDVTTRTQTT